MKILIMGLSGSGKSELAKELHKMLPNSIRINGDLIRSLSDDWDFSMDGRIRQANRIKEISDSLKHDYIIADFIAPTKKIRDIFKQDMLIWMDTTDSSQYADTDLLFEDPINYDFKIDTKDAVKHAQDIYQHLKAIYG
jgi:adenylylsulfate kinase